MPAEVVVYKILRPGEWDAFKSDGRFGGSPDDLRDGFIHLSSAGQVEHTLARHFSKPEDCEVRLVAIAVRGLGDRLKWETSRGGARFPHLYAELTVADIVETTRLSRGADGIYVMPEEIGR